jgi:hypothetical protein
VLPAEFETPLECTPDGNGNVQVQHSGIVPSPVHAFSNVTVAVNPGDLLYADPTDTLLGVPTINKNAWGRNSVPTGWAQGSIPAGSTGVINIMLTVL